MDVTAPGRELAKRFVSLGNMQDKTAKEIISVVGHPTCVSAMAHENQLLQWQAVGYHIALLFDSNGQLLKITHEHANFQAEPNGTIKSLGILLGLLVGLALLVLQFMH